MIGKADGGWLGPPLASRSRRAAVPAVGFSIVDEERHEHFPSVVRPPGRG